jgi:hypothetical protein
MSADQPDRRSTCAERISQRCFCTLPLASAVSKYSHECGLMNSTLVSLATGKLTVLASSNVPTP